MCNLTMPMPNFDCNGRDLNKRALKDIQSSNIRNTFHKKLCVDAVNRNEFNSMTTMFRGRYTETKYSFTSFELLVGCAGNSEVTIFPTGLMAYALAD